MHAAFAAFCTSPVLNYSTGATRDIGDAQHWRCASIAGKIEAAHSALRFRAPTSEHC